MTTVSTPSIHTNVFSVDIGKILKQDIVTVQLIDKIKIEVSLQGFFFAILGRGPRAFLIGKISDKTLNLGNSYNIKNG